MAHEAVVTQAESDRRGRIAGDGMTAAITHFLHGVVMPAMLSGVLYG